MHKLAARSWTCGTQMSSRAMELIWDVGQSVTIQHCLALVGAGVTIAPPFIPLPPLGVKSLIDSLLSFSLPAFTFPFPPSLSADFDLLVITVILSLVEQTELRLPFLDGLCQSYSHLTQKARSARPCTTAEMVLLWTFTADVHIPPRYGCIHW
jgi:hypothetical protein